MDNKGDLKIGEPHPVSFDALKYLKSIKLQDLLLYMESFASCSIDGNRTGEICAETLRRFLNKDPVSDRYILGLCWAIKSMREKENEDNK